MNCDPDSTGQTLSVIGSYKSEEPPPIYFPLVLNFVLEAQTSSFCNINRQVKESFALVSIHDTWTLLDIYGVGTVVTATVVVLLSVIANRVKYA